MTAFRPGASPPPVSTPMRVIEGIRASVLQSQFVSWAASSVGRAPRSQRGGREFEPPAVHLFLTLPTQATGLCASCSQPLTGRFCSNCGEEAHDPTSLTVRHFLTHTLAHETLHIDGKIWRTLRLLFFKPGFLAAEYAAGRRRPYVNPVRIFLIAIVAYA